jgi:hypothetical protein
MDGETVDKKPKKARKPYVWTPQRKEAFERMKNKRDEKLKEKKNNLSREKEEETNTKKYLSELLRSTSKIKSILAIIDGKNPPVNVVEKPVERIVAKEPPPPAPKPVIVQHKPKPKPPPEPEPEPEEEEYESEEEEQEEEVEEEVKPVIKPVQKPPPNSFRYTTKTTHVGLPKQPLPKPQPAPNPPAKKVSPFLFL